MAEIRKIKLSEQTSDRLYEMIVDEQRYAPGSKLPNENELSEALKVSRTTLREAISFLVAQGVLEIRRGKGTFVSEDLPAAGLDLTSLAGLRSRVRAKDLFEMRLIFEPEAAFYAAQRATDAELERIRHYAELEEGIIERGEDSAEIEMAFHNSIATATHNSFIGELVPLIYRSIERALRLSGTFPDIIANVVEDNRMLIEFLSRRNAEGARSAMRIHIIHAMDGLSAGMEAEARAEGAENGGSKEKNHL